MDDVYKNTNLEWISCGNATLQVNNYDGRQAKLGVNILLEPSKTWSEYIGRRNPIE